MAKKVLVILLLAMVWLGAMADGSGGSRTMTSGKTCPARRCAKWGNATAPNFSDANSLDCWSSVGNQICS